MLTDYSVSATFLVKVQYARYGHSRVGLYFAGICTFLSATVTSFNSQK